MSYSFDCDNKIIQLDTTVELDMLDLYSRWKDEVLSTIAGCDQAMRVVKEPLAGSTFIGPYYFIMNDWQIRPNNSAHELVVAGTVVQDATSSVSPFKVDDLSFTVSIVRQIAVEVQVVETAVSGLTPSESAQLTAIATVDTKVDAIETKAQADARQALLVAEHVIINQGVQKSSKLIPHNTDLS